MSLAILITGAYVFARLTGLMLTMPALNMRSMPMPARMLMVFAITMVMSPVVQSTNTIPPFGLLLVGVIAEIFLGVLMGGVVGMVFGGLTLGVEIISTQIGQSAALQFNPMMQVSQGPLGGIAALLASSVFLGVDLHHDMLRVIAFSFESIPAGMVGSPISGIEIWINYSKIVLVTGVRIAGPVLSLVFLVNSFMMVLTKIAPNMNVFFSVGFIFSMIGGLILFFHLLPHLIEGHIMVVREAVEQLPLIIDKIRSSNVGR
jgi:flagellar biosynthesis protein FliR